MANASRSRLAAVLARVARLDPREAALKPRQAVSTGMIRTIVHAVASLAARANRKHRGEAAWSPAPRSSRIWWYRKARNRFPGLPSWRQLRMACQRWPELRTIVTPPPPPRGGAAPRAGGPRRRGASRSPSAWDFHALAEGRTPRKRRKSSRPVEFADESIPFDHPMYTEEFWNS